MSPRCQDEPQYDYEKICQIAAKMAERVVQDLEAYSKLSDKKPSCDETQIATFERKELGLGQLLGTGGFNTVYALDQINCLDADTTTNNNNDDASTSTSLASSTSKRSSMAKTCCNDKKYAVKYLRRDIMDDLEDHCNGAADLMIETKILQTLPLHPHIIQLHGLASAGCAGFASGLEGGYFLIVDRLSATLSDRIEFWYQTNAPLLDRIDPICGLASAIAHLHEHNIVFRDLKPDNVGFDMEGNVQLFDFGLAKELNPSQATTNDVYDMSGETGSRRYMAPEVAMGLPYNLSADVYSFGVLMWQACALREPFAKMTIEEHFHFVAQGDLRPDMDPAWPEKLRNILKWSWTGDLHIRPPMKEIHRALKSLRKKESKSRNRGNSFSSDPLKSLDSCTETTSVVDVLRLDRNIRQAKPAAAGKSSPQPFSLPKKLPADMNASDQVKNISRMISEGLALSQDENR